MSAHPSAVAVCLRSRLPFRAVVLLGATALAWMGSHSSAIGSDSTPRIPDTKPAPPAVPAKGIPQLLTQDLTEGLTPVDLAQALAGEGVTVQNVVYTGEDTAAGLFSGGTGIIGFEEGVVLSSGMVRDVVGPNEASGTTTNHGTEGDAELEAQVGAGTDTNDAAALEFELIPEANTLFIEYVFASEEYNEFVNSAFNDAFALFVNGVNCATISDPQEGEIAVAINNVNNGNPDDEVQMISNPELYIDNDEFNPTGPVAGLNTEMDGLTRPLFCDAPVNPGVPNQIKLVVADVSDSILDSNVFLSASSIATVNNERSITPTVLVLSGDRYGASVATDGNLLAVSTLGTEDTPPRVEILRFVGGEAVQDEVLEFDGIFDQVPVAMQGGSLLVGLPGGATLAGAKGQTIHAALFRREFGQGWSLLRTFDLQGDAADRFGAAVAFDNDWVVIGAPEANGGAGAAYIFELEGTDVAPITNPDVAAGGGFGSTVKVRNGKIAIGAPGARIGFAFPGIVQVFEQTGTTVDDVAYQGVLVGQRPSSDDRFGNSLAIRPNAIVVGAPGEDGPGKDRGGVYVFDANTLALAQRIEPDITLNNANFGFAVETGIGSDISAGAPGLQAGSGGLFRFSPVSFEQQEFVNASGPTREFGAALSLSESGLLIGAPASSAESGTALLIRDPALILRADFE